MEILIWSLVVVVVGLHQLHLVHLHLLLRLLILPLGCDPRLERTKVEGFIE
jgi:hypothetical protein